MNREKRGMLVGMVFGDGCLRVRTRLKEGKYTYQQRELRIKHSTKQKAYAEHKAELVRNMFGGKCEARPTSVVCNGRVFPQVLMTKNHKYFAALYRVMYPGGKKTYTMQALSYLTPHGIALWYMDDGCARVNRNAQGWVTSCATELATCCTLEEALLIQTYFLSKHGIEVKLFTTRPNQYCIRMNTSESQKFARLIAPYVVPEMLYKLAHVSNLNVHECRTPIGTCNECGTALYAKRNRGLCGACYMRGRRRAAKMGDDIVRPNGNKNR